MMRRRAAEIGIGIVLAAWLAGGLAGCGKYGPPERAEEYQQKQKERRQEEAERRKKSPQETNEPIPDAP